jgi:hypothetical protein
MELRGVAKMCQHTVEYVDDRDRGADRAVQNRRNVGLGERQGPASNETYKLAPRASGALRNLAKARLTEHY